MFYSVLHRRTAAPKTSTLVGCCPAWAQQRPTTAPKTSTNVGCAVRVSFFYTLTRQSLKQSLVLGSRTPRSCLTQAAYRTSPERRQCLLHSLAATNLHGARKHNAHDNRNLRVICRKGQGLHLPPQKDTGPAPLLATDESLDALAPPSVTHPSPSTPTGVPPSAYLLRRPVHREPCPLVVPPGTEEDIGAWLMYTVVSHDPQCP